MFLEYEDTIEERLFKNQKFVQKYKEDRDQVTLILHKLRKNTARKRLDTTFL